MEFVLYDPYFNVHVDWAFSVVRIRELICFELLNFTDAGERKKYSIQNLIL